MMNRGRFWRRTPDASAIGALRRKAGVPGNEGVPGGTRAFLGERGRSWGNEGVPGGTGHFLEKRSYFFFLATLRVFFAVFFTALFAFFAFLAFLAMLPS